MKCLTNGSGDIEIHVGRVSKMKTPTFKLRFAALFSAIGTSVFSFAAIVFGFSWPYVAISILLGSTTGFIIGYRIVGIVGEDDEIGRIERRLSGVQRVLLIVGWLFVATCITALLLDGWNLGMFLSGVFFLICSSYLSFKHLRPSK